MEIIKELVSLESVDLKETLQIVDRKKTEWKTFAGQKPLFPVGKEFTLVFDQSKPLFGEGNFRHVRLTALNESHDTVSIPLSYFTRPVFTKDKSLAAFRLKDDGFAYLLGGQVLHNLSIPGGLTEDALVKHLHGTKVIVQKGDENIPYLALPYETPHEGRTTEDLRALLEPKNTFRIERVK